MIPWFIVGFIRAICRFFGLRVYGVGKIGGWGALSIRFARARPVDARMEEMLDVLAFEQAEMLGRPTGWARGRRRPAVG